LTIEIWGDRLNGDCRPYDSLKEIYGTEKVGFWPATDRQVPGSRRRIADIGNPRVEGRSVRATLNNIGARLNVRDRTFAHGADRDQEFCKRAGSWALPVCGGPPFAVFVQRTSQPDMKHIALTPIYASGSADAGSPRPPNCTMSASAASTVASMTVGPNCEAIRFASVR
jgi:hypothetical protein